MGNNHHWRMGQRSTRHHIGYSSGRRMWFCSRGWKRRGQSIRACFWGSRRMGKRCIAIIGSAKRPHQLGQTDLPSDWRYEYVHWILEIWSVDDDILHPIFWSYGDSNSNVTNVSLRINATQYRAEIFAAWNAWKRWEFCNVKFENFHFRLVFVALHHGTLWASTRFGYSLALNLLVCTESEWGWTSSTTEGVQSIVICKMLIFVHDRSDRNHLRFAWWLSCWLSILLRRTLWSLQWMSVLSGWNWRNLRFVRRWISHSRESWLYGYFWNNCKYYYYRRYDEYVHWTIEIWSVDDDIMHSVFQWKGGSHYVAAGDYLSTLNSWTGFTNEDFALCTADSSTQAALSAPKHGYDIAVSCCELDGSGGVRPDCNAFAKTYDEAVAICDGSYYRLCTLDEMLWQRLTDNEGCNFDGAYNWVSTECSRWVYLPDPFCCLYCKPCHEVEGHSKWTSQFTFLLIHYLIDNSWCFLCCRRPFGSFWRNRGAEPSFNGYDHCDSDCEGFIHFAVGHCQCVHVDHVGVSVQEQMEWNGEQSEIWGGECVVGKWNPSTMTWRSFIYFCFKICAVSRLWMHRWYLYFISIHGRCFWICSFVVLKHDDPHYMWCVCAVCNL